MWNVAYWPGCSDEQEQERAHTSGRALDNAIDGAPLRGARATRARTGRAQFAVAQLAVWGTVGAVQVAVWALLTLRVAWWWAGRYRWFWVLAVVLACLASAGAH
jgi:hypothetical protein